MSGIPPTQPTTIFNFGPVLDKILAAVQDIQQHYVTILRFNQILADLAGQVTLLNQNAAQIAGLSETVSNFTSLLEALIQALTGVATTALQEQEIALLNILISDNPPTAETGDFNADSAVIT